MVDNLLKTFSDFVIIKSMTIAITTSLRENLTLRQRRNGLVVSQPSHYDEAPGHSDLEWRSFGVVVHQWLMVTVWSHQTEVPLVQSYCEVWSLSYTCSPETWRLSIQSPCFLEDYKTDLLLCLGNSLQTDTLLSAIPASQSFPLAHVLDTPICGNGAKPAFAHSTTLRASLGRT